jgi:hypothetical protein
MIHVLGVDPGRPSGWAIVGVPDAGEVEIWCYGQTVISRQQFGQIAHHSNWGLNAENRYACIESQFIPSSGGKGQKERAKAVAILKTAKVAGRWEQSAEAHGWTLYHESPRREGVLAQTWRTALGGPNRMTSKMWEVWAIDQVKLRYGVELKKTWHHAADAICIATWAAERLRVERRGR